MAEIGKTRSRRLRLRAFVVLMLSMGVSPQTCCCAGGILMLRRCSRWCLFLCAAGLAVAQSGSDAGKIMRPADGSALPAGEVDIVATAPAGKLELDGQPLEAEEPFPNVYHAMAKAEPGEHALTLVWAGGRREIKFFIGADPPAEFKPFKPHPPPESVECTQCHGLSRRGRFRFKGGCFDCHQQEAFAKTHAHPVHQLQQCGMCHNAHGSTQAAHLTMSKELACKQCHN